MLNLYTKINNRRRKLMNGVKYNDTEMLNFVVAFN